MVALLKRCSVNHRPPELLQPHNWQIDAGPEDKGLTEGHAADSAHWGPEQVGEEMEE